MSNPFKEETEAMNLKGQVVTMELLRPIRQLAGHLDTIDKGLCINGNNIER